MLRVSAAGPYRQSASLAAIAATNSQHGAREAPLMASARMALTFTAACAVGRLPINRASTHDGNALGLQQSALLERKSQWHRRT
jgi:hypothetical protein